jgi:hypothetical protein
MSSMGSPAWPSTSSSLVGDGESSVLGRPGGSSEREARKGLVVAWKELKRTAVGSRQGLKGWEAG